MITGYIWTYADSLKMHAAEQQYIVHGDVNNG